DRMIEFARVLPRLRDVAAEHLQDDGLTRRRVLAGAVRLLDRGFFRIGGESYAVQNDTYGLATMKKEHARVLRGNIVLFEYVAKGEKERLQSVVDPDVCELVRAQAPAQRERRAARVPRRRRVARRAFRGHQRVHQGAERRRLHRE